MLLQHLVEGDRILRTHRFKLMVLAVLLLSGTLVSAPASAAGAPVAVVALTPATTTYSYTTVKAKLIDSSGTGVSGQPLVFQVLGVAKDGTGTETWFESNTSPEARVTDADGIAQIGLSGGEGQFVVLIAHGSLKPSTVAPALASVTFNGQEDVPQVDLSDPLPTHLLPTASPPDAVLSLTPAQVTQQGKTLQVRAGLVDSAGKPLANRAIGFAPFRATYRPSTGFLGDPIERDLIYFEILESTSAYTGSDGTVGVDYSSRYPAEELVLLRHGSNNYNTTYGIATMSFLPDSECLECPVSEPIPVPNPVPVPNPTPTPVPVPTTPVPTPTTPPTGFLETPQTRS